jgi:hypothetical protein
MIKLSVEEVYAEGLFKRKDRKKDGPVGPLAGGPLGQPTLKPHTHIYRLTIRH